MRRATVLVAILAFVPLTITVVGCDLQLFDTEPSSEPGSLGGWQIENFYLGGSHLECPTRFDIFLQGASPSDARPWAVGASVEVEPLFDRPCGFFTKCPPERHIQHE